MKIRWGWILSIASLILLVAGCKGGLQRDILGMWKDTKGSSNLEFIGTTIEFMQDGTLIYSREWYSSQETYVGDYKILEDNKIRVSLSSFPSIILTVNSIDNKYLSFSSDSNLGEYMCCGSNTQWLNMVFNERFEKVNDH